ncbi:hypothetical protein [uncultured Microscilla sp.]|uniref:hypothetical protein n=1 Tax=uncultured Microscilla sp. TaxID=432653 RepID=UPI00260BB2FC|nr:hypothetical protein [uncultured Microscilla sp.]
MTIKNHFLNIFKHALHAIFLFSVFATLNACQKKTLKDYGHDMEAINSAIKNRKIQRISEPEFKEWVGKKGGEVSRLAQKYLNRATTKGIEEKTIASSKEFSHLLPINHIDSLAKKYQVNIEAINFERKSLDDLYPIEAQLLTKFKNEEIALKPGIQYAEKRRKFLFIAPIYLNGSVGMWSIHFDRNTVIKQITKERQDKKKRRRRK